MKTRLLLLLALLLVSPAFALYSVMKVRSDAREEDGITARAKRGQGGAYDFTVTRSMPGAILRQGEAGPEYTIEAVAELEIYSANGMMAKTRVASEKTGNKTVYVFAIAPECIPYSHFRITERRVFKDPQILARGGVMYDCDIAEIGASAKAREPQHP